MAYAITVNGVRRTIDVEGDTPLLWVLRDTLDIKGPKFGCGLGLCGACTVHLNGRAVRSCLTPLASVGARSVTTLEGIGVTEIGRRLKAAWLDLDVIQCGYCQGGQIMTAADLLARNARPTDSDIDQAMSGNICRCCTYTRIRAAIKQAAGLPTTDKRGV